MAIEKTSSGAGSSLVEVLDHVLDKGIVIDAWVAVSVIGIELVTIEARVIVASVETYVKYSEILGTVGPIAGGLRQPSQRRTLGEGLQDIQGGLENLPLIGGQKDKEKVSTPPRSSAPKRKSSKTTKSRTRSGKKK